MHPRNHHVLRSPDDGGAGGAPAAAPDPAAGEAPAAPPAAAPAAPEGTPAAAPAPGPSALAAGAPAPGAAPAAPPAAAAADPVWGRIPEKFRVKNEDGSANLNASYEKALEHRDHLEKRLGSGDIPPKESKDYVTNVPEALKDGFKPEELNAAPRYQEFRDRMHKAGLSQAQFDAATSAMFDYSIALQNATAKLSTDECVAQLRTEWKDDATYNAQVQAAYRGASAYGDVDKLMSKYGNDPDFIRFAAAAGKEVGEDTSAGPDIAAGMSDTDVEALQKSDAYWKAEHPNHTEVKAKVEAFYSRKFGTAPKSSSSLSVGVIGR